MPWPSGCHRHLYCPSSAHAVRLSLVLLLFGALAVVPCPGVAADAQAVRDVASVEELVDALRNHAITTITVTRDLQPSAQAGIETALLRRDVHITGARPNRSVFRMLVRPHTAACPTMDLGSRLVIDLHDGAQLTISHTVLRRVQVAVDGDGDGTNSDIVDAATGLASSSGMASTARGSPGSIVTDQQQPLGNCMPQVVLLNVLLQPSLSSGRTPFAPVPGLASTTHGGVCLQMLGDVRIDHPEGGKGNDDVGRGRTDARALLISQRSKPASSASAPSTAILLNGKLKRSQIAVYCFTKPCAPVLCPERTASGAYAHTACNNRIPPHPFAVANPQGHSC